MVGIEIAGRDVELVGARVECHEPRPVPGVIRNHGLQGAGVLVYLDRRSGCRCAVERVSRRVRRHIDVQRVGGCHTEGRIRQEAGHLEAEVGDHDGYDDEHAQQGEVAPLQHEPATRDRDGLRPDDQRLTRGPAACLFVPRLFDLVRVEAKV